ncbi:MAG: ABC transporter ATP-binding protein [Spirochaetaceae bacterium]|nr:ABC transporter ATP-binding protein [Spirochaetaceae bacterium]
MIEYKHVYKSYKGSTINVIQDLNFKIADGELLVLVGESGCGKTTTMQMLNRLIEPTKGTIEINGEDISKIDPITLRKEIGYVIQNIGLFPHWTIAENIGTLLTLKKIPQDEITEKVKEYMDLVNLDFDEFAYRYPNQLSGGQQQRVGVARALINEPELILMDEPFSALDPITKEQLQDELLRLHEELNKTIIFVTHDIDEAIKLGDRIAVMQHGKIAQLDSAEEILKNPANEFVEKFVGTNRLWKTPEMLTAVDVMNENFPVIRADRSSAQAIESMKEHKTLILCVVEKIKGDHDKLLGLIGSNRLAGVKNNSIKIRDIMKKDFTAFPPTMSLAEIMSIRESKELMFSPVIDENEYLIGVITNTSILNVLSQIMPGKEDY